MSTLIQITKPTELIVNNTPITGGVAGRVLFQGTGNVLQQSSSLFWDSTNNRLGIGTNTPVSILNLNSNNNPRLTLSEVGRTETSSLQMIQGSVQFNANAYFDGTNWQRDTTALPSWNLNMTPDGNDRFAIRRSPLGSGAITWTEFLSVRNTGNVLINTTTDAGFRLDVNGTARVVNALTLGNVVLSLSSQGGGTISCANSAGANTGSFINLSGPVYLNPTAGNSGMFAITGQYASSSGTANFNHLNLAPTLNTTGTYSGIVRGIYYNPTLTSVTGVTHRAIETTTGDVLFGTTSGSVGIGTTSPARALEVFRSGLVDNSINGVRITVNHNSATAQAALEFYHQAGSNPNSRIATDIGNGGLFPSMYFIHNGINAMKIANTGNVQIGTTTDAGFRLDVNGTARVQGNVTFGSTSTTGTATIQGSNIVELILSDTLNGRSVRLYKNAGSGYIIENNSGNQMSYGYASNYWMSWRNSTKSIAIASTGSEPTPDATSIFDLQSTTKGFLPPRMTTTQKNAIVSPAAGLVVYDTTLAKLCVYTTTWETITSA